MLGTEGIYYKFSDKETLKFRKIVLENLAKSATADSIDDCEYNGIGRLGEKQMHSAIKLFICPDESLHEIKITESEKFTGKSDVQNSRRKYVADVILNDTIYEIQTGGFSPLKEKIKWILDNTEYNVVVIHPISQTKWVSKIMPNGDITCRRKSPVHGRVEDIASQLYFFTEFLNSPRFSLVLLMVEAEQYVKASSRGRCIKKYELIPMSLIGAYVFKSIEDYKYFIRDDLPESFTVKDFSKSSKIYGMDAYSIVKTLCEIALLEEDGIRGRAKTYKRTQKNASANFDF